MTSRDGRRLPMLALSCLATAVTFACAGGRVHTPVGQAPPTSGFTDGGVYYEATGRGEAIVLVHAFSMDRRMWDAQVAALSPGFRVVRYDLRSHGRSTDALGSSAYDDLAAVLDALRIPRATIVGLSAGATVAIDFALETPSRVQGLVLASPGVSGYRSPERRPWMTPVADAARAGDALLAADRWAETPPMTVADRGARARIRELARANAKLWLMTSNRERPLDPPALGRLSAIRVPTLILVGGTDLAETRDVATILADSIAGSHLEVIAGAGHMINFAAPERFNEVVRRFLEAERRR